MIVPTAGSHVNDYTHYRIRVRKGGSAMAKSFDELSRGPSMSESGLRKRAKSRRIGVEKGARGKWLLSEELITALKKADPAMKNGAGEVTTKRVVGLTPHRPHTPESTDHEAPGPDTALIEHQAHEPVTEEKTGDIAPELQAILAALSTQHSALQRTREDGGQVLDLLTDTHKRLEALHAEKEAALRELADTKALVATFQERSENLKARNDALEGEVKLLKAVPEPRRPWWRVW